MNVLNDARIEETIKAQSFSTVIRENLRIAENLLLRKVEESRRKSIFECDIVYKNILNMKCEVEFFI